MITSINKTTSQQANTCGEYPHIVCRRFLLSDLVGGQRMLDVGCGDGELMTESAQAGYIVSGTEVDAQLIESAQARGLDVRHGPAEALPFPKHSFDRLQCSVVLPYTDEQQAIREWARVLKPGGSAYASFHGLGYAIHQIIHGPRLGIKFFGARSLLNTYFYWMTHRRLPGFWGDTLCQSQRRLRHYYSRCGLVLARELVVETALGYPRFLCHQLHKPILTTSKANCTPA